MRDEKIEKILDRANGELRNLLESWPDEDMQEVFNAVGDEMSVITVIDRIVHRKYLGGVL